MGQHRAVDGNGPLRTRGNQNADAETAAALPETTGAGAILALEGALQPAGAALAIGGRLVAIEHLPQGRRSRADLFSAACEVLSSAGLSPERLTGVAVGVGPGSYTGVRVALAVARGLVLASRRPLTVSWTDSVRLLARAAGYTPPVTVALRWGRHRVLIASADAESDDVNAQLVATRDLAALVGLAEREIVVAAEATDLAWPADWRLVPAYDSGVTALAKLAIEERLQAAVGIVPEPSYVVPPDAVLPARGPSLPDGFEIVTLTERALDDTEAIEQLSFRHPWSRDLLLEELTPRADRVALGVRDGESRLAAVTFLRFGHGALSIFSIAVDPAFRRRGFARALLRRAVAEARRRGLARVDLEVREGDRGAVALYRSEGFVPTGRRLRYYPDGAAALFMSLVIRRDAG